MMGRDHQADAGGCKMSLQVTISPLAEQLQQCWVGQLVPATECAEGAGPGHALGLGAVVLDGVARRVRARLAGHLSVAGQLRFYMLTTIPQSDSRFMTVSFAGYCTVVYNLFCTGDYNES